MTTEFADNMKAMLHEYQNAQEPTAKTTKRSGKSATKYEVNASGIDMEVSRIVNGKNTMKLFIYLSQEDKDGNGTMFVKSMRDGVLKEATEDNINTFLNGLSAPMMTGSDAIPVLRSGKEFARRLLQMREPTLITLAKEGLINSELLDDKAYSLPWYAAEDRWYQAGFGVSFENRHAKLLRHMFKSIADKYHTTYHQALENSCGKSRYGYGYIDESTSYVWAFSMLADLFDEPYAKACFDEYIDNVRLSGLTPSSINTLVSKLVGYDGGKTHWNETVRLFREGRVITVLDKNRLWQFFQQSIGVGLGKKLSGYIEMYADYLKQAHECDGKVKDKYPEYLQVAHDIYSEKYQLIKEFNDIALLKKRVEAGKPLIDQTHGEYQLKTLETIKDFFEEAQQNCNCVASYVDNVKAGKCWIASFRKVGAERTELTIEINPKGEMVQIKGRYNREPNKQETELLKEFQEGIYKKMKKD